MTTMLLSSSNYTLPNQGPMYVVLVLELLLYACMNVFLSFSPEKELFYNLYCEGGSIDQ